MIEDSSCTIRKDGTEDTISSNMVDSFNRLTDHYTYFIVDYCNNKFLYVSENVNKWCSMNSSQIKELGRRFYREFIPHSEQGLLIEINKKALDFFYKIPLSERLNYCLSFDLNIVNVEKKNLAHHSITPISLTNEGNIKYALYAITIASNKDSGNVFIKKAGSKIQYEYSIVNHEWIRQVCASLSPMEKDIIKLSAQGHTATNIADKLCKSVDTVKATKRELFHKLKVRNITEALYKLVNENCI